LSDLELTKQLVVLAHVGGHDEGNDPFTEPLVLLLGETSDDVTPGTIHHLKRCRAVVILKWGNVVVPMYSIGDVQPPMKSDQARI